MRFIEWSLKFAPSMIHFSDLKYQMTITKFISYKAFIKLDNIWFFNKLNYRTSFCNFCIVFYKALIDLKPKANPCHEKL